MAHRRNGNGLPCIGASSPKIWSIFCGSINLRRIASKRNSRTICEPLAGYCIVDTEDHHLRHNLIHNDPSTDALLLNLVWRARI